MLIITENKIIYKLGRNAKENFQLIDEAYDINDNYWWFHISDHPSGHCIIFSKDITVDMISTAANIVKQYSKLKDQKKIKIVYTQVKNVEKTKTIGQVLLKGSTNFISV